jgi:hypothetical protein
VWTRTEVTSRWPFDAIKLRWKDRADDPVWMTALTETPVNRPPVERWASTFETVGLTGGKREAARLFRILGTEASQERHRITLAGEDEKAVIAATIEQVNDHYDNEIKQLVIQLPQFGVIRAVEREWGASVYNAVKAETIKSICEPLKNTINAGGDPLRCLEQAISDSQSVVNTSATGMLTSYVKNRDMPLFLTKTKAHTDFIVTANDLLTKLRAIRAAKEMSAEIERLNRRAPVVHSPVKSSGE